MKILVDEMPTKVEDCIWSNPTDNPWNDRTIWFCQWALSHSETCPMKNGAECPYFTEAKSELDAIVDKWNAIPNANPLNSNMDWGNCVDTFANLLFTPPKRKEDE